MMNMLREVHIRPARREDIRTIVRLLADDELGRDREDLSEPLSQAYFKAFDEIVADKRNLVIVAEAADGGLLGCLQMTFIPGLSHQGAERALIEDVRVDKHHRGRKIGHHMLDWAIGEARRRHSCLIELFVHETRFAARRFYENHGFKDSHRGMRLQLA
ncbi:GNAT family N-acetyltransferase [Aestuariivirga sp. YIM B02566]|nr:GNAT family N-acetyltransferase [Aestuariivirga sp. YIM B02566]